MASVSNPAINTTQQIHVNPRLPVNSRRTKVAPDKRKRAERACDSCNVKRAKCSGGTPCDRCQQTGRECTVTTKPPMVTISESEYIELQRRANRATEPLLPDISDFENVSSGRLAKPWDGRILMDRDGCHRFLGGTSGAAFLHWVREDFINVFPNGFDPSWFGRPVDTSFIESIGKYQTHDSRPLLADDRNTDFEPSNQQALEMLSELRYWTQNGPMSYKSGGTLYFFNIDDVIVRLQSDTIDSMGNPLLKNKALMNAAFAVACQFNPSCGPKGITATSFFARARQMSGNPLDQSTMSDASVLTLLGFYLLNNNRRDAAYIYISVALHILVVHGIHRGWQCDEGDKRLFWTIYNLDRWLAMLMGRPAMIVDAEIKLKMPQEDNHLPSPIGLCVQIQLSRISHFICTTVYDRSAMDLAESVNKTLAMLSDWKRTLPEVLQLNRSAVYSDRAMFEVQLHHNQLLILTLRPLLSSALKAALLQLRSAIPAGTHHRISAVSDPCWDCRPAARENILLTERLLGLRPNSILSHASIHYLFNGALYLLLHGMVASDESLQDDWLLIEEVARILGVDNDSNRDFARDCSKVLQDLLLILESFTQRRRDRLMGRKQHEKF